MPIFDRRESSLQIANVFAVDADGADADVVKTRHQIRQRGLARAARADQRDDLPGLYFQIQVFQTESIGRAGITEADVLKPDGMLKTHQPLRIGFFANGPLAIQIFEDFLGCAQRLLENVVDAGEALDRFVQHQQGDDEAGELAGGHLAGLDLQAGVGEETDDGKGAEKFDQGRSHRLLRDIAKTAVFQMTGGGAEAVAFELFRPEGFHHLVAADGLLKDLVEVGGVVLGAAAGAADALAKPGCGHKNERQHGQTDDGQLPIGLDHDEQ